MQIGFLIILFIIGTCLGSFLCCQARRLKIKQTHKKPLGKRSVCLSCKYQLKWYDNLPIISWLFLKGKCRKCGKKIGIAEFISEVGLGLVFLALGTTIDINDSDSLTWLIFSFTLVFTVLIGFLAIYDGLYGELPTLYLFASIICAIVIVLLKTAVIFTTSGSIQDSFIFLIFPALSALLFGGLYLFLYLISKGKWVGDGDWLLATAIAFTLSHPWFALIALFLTNCFALIYALPNLKKHSKIRLGPFMVAAFIVTTVFYTFFDSLINMI